jgi:hypothetical protein
MSIGGQQASRSDQPPALRRLVFLGLAVVAGIVLSLLAPEDWQPGQGTTILDYQGESVIEAPVTVGSKELVSFVGAGSGVEVALTYVEGVPVDGPVRATISVTRSGERVQPDVSSIVLRVDLPSGSTELIPVIRWNDTEQQLDAQRRPP